MSLFLNVSNHYDILYNIHLDQQINQKFYLGEKYNKCRFCGKSSPEVTFENDAHAFPEFIGNKYVLSHYECDMCNAQFSRTIEADMANLMNISHVIEGVPGKKRRIPIYQRSGPTLQSDGKNIVIKNMEKLPDCLLNSKQFSISLPNPAFVPIAVYKCLTKMALTIMPEEELHNFSNTFEWINELKHDNSRFVFDSLLLVYSESETPLPLRATLFKRKHNVQKDIPYNIFRLTYATFSFQIYIPLCSLDNNKSYKAEQLPYFSHLDDFVKGLNSSKRQNVDFNVTYQVKNDTTQIKIENLDK